LDICLANNVLILSAGNNFTEHWVPTANKEDYKLIPHNGVYVVKSIINQNHFWNDEHRVQPHCIGRETVDRSPFFDFDTDLYDQK
jgi:riboflavin kinase/FMN adenylyltransferase